MQINTHGRLSQYETKWPHYRIKVVPSKYLSPLQNQDLIDLKKNGLMEMILLQNQEPAFYIWHLSTKSKTHTWWGNRCFRGPILYRIKVIPSHHLSPLQNQDLKIWHWWACSDYKIKDLRTSPALFLQNQFPTQNVSFVHSQLSVGAPVYRIRDLPRYSPKMTKIDGSWVVASPWSLIL